MVFQRMTIASNVREASSARTQAWTALTCHTSVQPGIIVQKDPQLLSFVPKDFIVLDLWSLEWKKQVRHQSDVRQDMTALMVLSKPMLVKNANKDNFVRPECGCPPLLLAAPSGVTVLKQHLIHFCVHLVPMVLKRDFQKKVTVTHVMQVPSALDTETLLILLSLVLLDIIAQREVIEETNSSALKDSCAKKEVTCRLRAMLSQATLTAAFIKIKEAKQNVRSALPDFTVTFQIAVLEKLELSCQLCVLPGFTALRRLAISLKRCVNQELIMVSWEQQMKMNVHLAGADSTVPKKDTLPAMAKLKVQVGTHQSYVPLATIVLLDQSASSKKSVLEVHIAKPDLQVIARAREEHQDRAKPELFQLMSASRVQLAITVDSETLEMSRASRKQDARRASSASKALIFRHRMMRMELIRFLQLLTAMMLVQARGALTKLTTLDSLVSPARKVLGVTKNLQLRSLISVVSDSIKTNMLNLNAKLVPEDIIVLNRELISLLSAMPDITVRKDSKRPLNALLDIIQMSLVCTSQVNAKNVLLVIIAREELTLNHAKLAISVNVEQQRLKRLLIKMVMDHVQADFIAKLQLFFQNLVRRALMGLL